MPAEEVREILDRRPFESVRLHISSGQYVDVKHQEMVIVSRSLVAAGAAGLGRVADYIIHYNPIHVVKIEPFDGNKRKSQRRPGEK